MSAVCGCSAHSQSPQVTPSTEISSTDIAKLATCAWSFQQEFGCVSPAPVQLWAVWKAIALGLLELT